MEFSTCLFASSIVLLVLVLVLVICPLKLNPTAIQTHITFKHVV